MPNSSWNYYDTALRASSPPNINPATPVPEHRCGGSTASTYWLLLGVAAAGLTNLGSVVTIVVANKVVMSTYKFSFPVCLTWFHSVVTALGMVAMAAAGMFQVRAAVGCPGQHRV